MNDEKTNENAKIFSNNVAAFGFGFFVVALLLMYWAEPYPVVWRYSMFLNTPNSLLFVSLVAFVGVVAPLSGWISRRTGMPGDFGHSFAVYFMFCLPVLLGFTQLGLIINGAFDTSTPQVYQTAVLSNRISKSTKGGTHWHLNVRDWRDSSDTIQFTVSRHQFETTAIGSSMSVVTKKGFLGYEWVVSHS